MSRDEMAFSDNNRGTSPMSVRKVVDDFNSTTSLAEPITGKRFGFSDYSNRSRTGSKRLLAKRVTSNSSRSRIARGENQVIDDFSSFDGSED